MNRLSTSLRSDLVIVAGLVALGVAARLLPHEPNFTPIAASTLFAATVLRTRLLAFVVPILALVISDMVLASEMTSIRTVVYAMFMLPAVVASCRIACARQACSCRPSLPIRCCSSW